METERTLFLNGTIAEESWFDDDITPQLFKEDLLSGSGDITVWVNSPGGDCVAAAQIYNMLMDYNGNVTVKIDGIAASAASVIAMAGTRVLMSPVSMLMIHNPMTVAMGNAAEMEKAIDMLASVKESIINAYELKTGMSRAKISHLMDDETWMDATKAVELGFADDILSRPSLKKEDENSKEDDEKVVIETEEDDEELEDKTEEDSDEETEIDEDNEAEEDSDEKDTTEESESEFDIDEDDDEDDERSTSAMLFSRKTVDSTLMRKIKNHNKKPYKNKARKKGVRSAKEIINRLDTIKNFI